MTTLSPKRSARSEAAAAGAGPVGVTFPVFSLPLTRFAFLLGLVLAGCGVPGPPVPPTAKIPVAPLNLEAQQSGEQVLLRWQTPRLHTDGSRIEGWPRLEVHRAFLSEARPTTQAFADESRVAYTIPEGVVDTFLEGEAVVFPDVLGPERLLEQAGQFAVYAVKAVNEKGQGAGISNLAAVRLHPVPTPVRRVEARVTERGIELRWDAPTDTTSGTPLEGIAGYEVYRSRSGGPGSFVLHGTAATSRYEDVQFSFGQTYFYQVRTVAQFGSDTVTSENSRAVEVEARDVFPPPAPANLIVVAGEGRVDLTWDASVIDDLAGYVVYRSREPGRGFQRLNQPPLAAQSFTDQFELEAGLSYYYLVTAVDKEGNESGYSEEISATPRAVE